MKTNYLLPNKYKTIGWILLVLGLISGVLLMLTDYESQLLQTKVLAVYNNDSIFENNKGFFKVIENSIANELSAIAIIIGGLLVGFSKEKIEDEFVSKLRMDSLAWAMIVNYIVLLFSIVFIYNLTFFDVLVFNMFTPLLFFIIRFNYLKTKA